MFAAFLEQATGLAALLQPAEIDCCGEAHSQGDQDDEPDCPPECCSACAPLRTADRTVTSDVVVFIAGEWLVARDQSPPIEPEPRRVRHVPRSQAG